MKRAAANPEQLQMLRRLRRAGCPVDLEHLPQPRCPLRDLREAGIHGPNIFPIADGFGVAFGIKALACAALTICEFDLRANWFKGPISWMGPCEQHPDQYCFHNRSGSHFSAASGPVLTGRTWLLRRGNYLEGFLFGALHESLRSTLGETLETTLSIADLAGNEYQVGVSLLNEMSPAIMDHSVGEP